MRRWTACSRGRPAFGSWSWTTPRLTGAPSSHGYPCSACLKTRASLPAATSPLARVTTPMVLFINPDVRFVGGSLPRLVEEAVTHPQAAVIAPLVLNTDGTVQLSLRHFPRLGRECAERLGLHRLPFSSGIGLRVRNPAAYRTSGWVEWASGSVFLARVDALRAIGGFDAAFFVYATEIDLALRLAGAGWGMFFSPVAAFSHTGGVRRTDARYPSSVAASSLVARRHYPRTYMLYVVLKVVEFSIRILVTTVRTTAGREVELQPSTLLKCFPLPVRF